MKMRIEMKKIHLLLLSFFAGLTPAVAQQYDYALEILPDKKVIYVDKLGMAGNTSLKDVLLTMPELLSRTGNDAFSNFDLQIDGKSTDAEKDVMLEQIRIGEIEKVEISVTPSVAQQKNGQGGVINVVPKKLDEGFSGEAFANATTEWDFMPSVNLFYKKNKLEVRGTLSMEYYQPDAVQYSEEFDKEVTAQILDTLRENFCQETAKLSVKYGFTDRDVLKLWVVESWRVDKGSENVSRHTVYDKSATQGPGWQYYTDESSVKDLKKNDLVATVMSEYGHTFNGGGKFTFSANYKYGQNREQRNYLEYDEFSRNPYTVDGELKLEQPLLKGDLHKVDMDLGINASFNPTIADTFRSENTYCSPYLTLKYNVGKWNFHAGARYQFFKRKYSASHTFAPVESEESFFKDSHDVTSDLNIVWNVAPDHILRLILTHGIMRPNDYMFYPNPVQDKLRNIWIVGNPNLENTKVNYVDLNYVFHWNENGRYLVFNALVGYNRADGLIEEKVVERDSGGSTHPTGFGPTFYTTFLNTGVNNIVKANVSLFYSKGIFSMSFAGNLFGNFMHRESGIDRYKYYNLSFSPIFNFRRQWVLGGKLMYNSYVEKQDSYLGDCFYMQIRLHKTIGHWTIHGEISDVFDYLSGDISTSGNKTCITYYDMYPRYFGLGFSYRF